MSNFKNVDLQLTKGIEERLRKRSFSKQCEIISKYVYIKNCLSTEYSAKYIDDMYDQIYGDFIFYRLNELNKLRDFHFLEVKGIRQKHYKHAKLHINMKECQPIEIENVDDPREEYKQSNTGTSIGHGMSNAQPKVLIAYVYDRDKIYIFKNYRKLNKELKRLYQDVPIEELPIPFERNLNVPDYYKGKHYKNSDCMVINLDKINDKFIKEYDVIQIRLNWTKEE